MIRREGEPTSFGSVEAGQNVPESFDAETIAPQQTDVQRAQEIGPVPRVDVAPPDAVQTQKPAPETRDFSASETHALIETSDLSDLEDRVATNMEAA